MSKKKSATIINPEFEEAVIQGTTISPASLLKKQMEAYPNVSIRKLANAANVTYGRLLKASKDPILGVPYDPTSTNYEAMAQILKVDTILDLDWEALNEVDTKATLVKDIDVFSKDMLVYMRKDKAAPFRIIHKTKTHIVVQRIDQETPYAWSYNTFMLYGPSLTPRTVVEP